jgi:MoaA/NifB/PqqE/SkfB family radical SAM enzyme
MSLAGATRDWVRYALPALRPRTPPFIILFVTRRCQMRCRHCFDAAAEHGGADLSLDEMDRLSRELGPVRALMLSGGEPFLRDDLAALCHTFIKRNRVRVLSIPTNGYDADRICAGTERILACDPRVRLTLNLSLDGLTDTHDAVRRVPQAFARAMATAERLQPLRRSHPRLTVTFVATLCQANLGELPDLAQLVKDRFDARLEISLLRGEPVDPTFALPAPEKLFETLDRLEQTRAGLSGRVQQCFRDLRRQTLLQRRQVVPCLAGHLIGVVYANGDVSGCELLPAVGNLREASFDAIWHGERAVAQRRSIASRACTCTHECFLWPSLAYSWKLPWRLMTGFGKPDLPR